MKPTRLLSFLAVFTPFLASGLDTLAADVNLVGDTASSQNWSTVAVWDNNAAPTEENHYFTNGHLLRTPDMGKKGTAFSGGSLTINPGKDGSRGVLSLKAATTHITNLLIGAGDVGNAANFRDNLPATVKISHLTILATATREAPARFIGKNRNQQIYLNVGTLSGSGYVEFTSSRPNSLSITDGSAFIGTLGVMAGSLTLTSEISIPDAAFIMASTASLVLSNDLRVSSFTFGTLEVPKGTYTSIQLNTRLSTSAFSGDGRLYVASKPNVTAAN